MALALHAPHVASSSPTPCARARFRCSLHRAPSLSPGDVCVLSLSLCLTSLPPTTTTREVLFHTGQPPLTPLADFPLLVLGGGFAQRGTHAAAAQARLAAISALSAPALAQEVASRLRSAAQLQARGVCPSEAASVAHDLLPEVAGALGGRLLAAVFAAFCEDYGGAACGFPDLLLWRPGRTTARLVEVKARATVSLLPRLLC